MSMRCAVPIGGVVVGTGHAWAAPILRPWERPTDPETMITVAAWWVGVALAGWLALSVGLWIPVLRRGGSRAGPRRSCVPGSRQLAEALLVVAAAACTPATESTAPPRIEILGTVAVTPPPASTASTTDLGREPATEGSPSIRSGGHDAPARSPLLDWLDRAGRDEAAAVDPAAPTSHIVEPGEHFWSIARAAVERGLGHSPSDAEITDYWVTLIRANRDRIRSGHPDLIHPGEILVLPPPPGAGP